MHRTKLENGLEVIVARQGDLPVVAASFAVRMGVADESPGRAGLARALSELLESGTERRDADALAWALESAGIQLDVSAGWDSIVGGTTVPAERFDQALGMLAEVVREPSFPEDEVLRVRERQMASLLQRRKDPRSLASDMSARFTFAPRVPYGRPAAGTRTTVSAIERDDVVAFYRSAFGPGHAALVIVGDIAPRVAVDAARRQFGDWAEDVGEALRFDVEPRVDRTTVFLVDRPGSVQSELRITDIGVERAHPDYLSIRVMNTVLGGAFTSRLNMNLRERNGFTYGARSGFSARRRPGPFSIGAAVGTDVTAAALREALHEVRLLRDEGPTDAEVEAARDYIAGILPLQLQTVQQLAARLAGQFIYGMPDDYLATYQDRVRSVSTGDAARVARERLRPDRFAITVVGDAGAIRADIEALELGPVELVDAADEGASDSAG
ncbi:MAG: pitrilysin family protein [Gemmatimonadota bacterium]